VRSRTLALIGASSGARQATHTSGFPLDPEKMLPAADVVLLVGSDDGDAMLFRYTAHGEIGGDTWHPDIAHAQGQAASEFGDSLGEWMEVPEDVNDPHEFAIRYAADRLNSRGDW
jgi:hypothetical protein